MDDGNVPCGIILDLSKAYNTLDHNILLQKWEFTVSDGNNNRFSRVGKTRSNTGWAIMFFYSILLFDSNN